MKEHIAAPRRVQRLRQQLDMLLTLKLAQDVRPEDKAEIERLERDIRALGAEPVE